MHLKISMWTSFRQLVNIETYNCSDCVCIDTVFSYQFLCLYMKMSRRPAAICWEKESFLGYILKCSTFLEFSNLAYDAVSSITNTPEYLSIPARWCGFNFAVSCNLQFYFACCVGYIWDELIRSCRRPSCGGDLLVQTATREAQEGPSAWRQLISTHTPLAVLPTVTPPFQTHIPGTWINPWLRWKKSRRSWL